MTDNSGVKRVLKIHSAECGMMDIAQMRARNQSLDEVWNSWFQEYDVVRGSADGSSEDEPVQNGCYYPMSFHAIKRLREECFIQSLATDGKKIDPAHLATGLPIMDRYKVMFKIGQGAYGNVYQASDLVGGPGSGNPWKALKVIKAKHISKGPSKLFRELDKISYLYQMDSVQAKRYVVYLHSAFTTHGHLFFVYDLLGPSVARVNRGNHRRGFSLQQSKEMAHQLILALKFLGQQGLTHRDIKTDNLVFVNSICENVQPADGGPPLKVMKDCSIRLIDFGSAVLRNEGNKIKTATTPQYRAPESTLTFRWTPLSDVWSAGCSIYEIFTGNLLFPGATEEDICYLWEFILGTVIPTKMVAENFVIFDADRRLKKVETDVITTSNSKPFADVATSYANTVPGSSPLFAVICDMLRMDPDNRPQASDLLRHPIWKD